MWADGLTMLRSNRAVVDHCLFVDNTDVDLIVGGAVDGVVTSNTVRHTAQASFAGLMLDNFNGTTPGDFRGAQVTANDIGCGASLCDFGIQLGPHPWYPSANILGGVVTGNASHGAKIGINVDGAGTPEAPMVVTGNTFGPGPTSASFLCGTRATTPFNVSPDSVVDLGQGPRPRARSTSTTAPEKAAGVGASSQGEALA